MSPNTEAELAAARRQIAVHAEDVDTEWELLNMLGVAA